MFNSYCNHLFKLCKNVFLALEAALQNWIKNMFFIHRIQICFPNTLSVEQSIFEKRFYVPVRACLRYPCYPLEFALSKFLFRIGEKCSEQLYLSFIAEHFIQNVVELHGHLSIF